MSVTEPRALLEQLYRAAVERALPLKILGAHLPEPPRGRTLVLGAGKAAGSMAQAVEKLWPPDAPLDGVVVTRYGHVPPRPQDLAARVAVLEASHPVPDEAGFDAARRMLELCAGLTADDLVLVLISGGGSSLLTMPIEELSFEAKKDVNRALLESGAKISEMNCVRKRLSLIKGGRLAAACGPARVVTLLISDVPGDDPAVIASGPTVPDPTTCEQALEIVERYRIPLPDAVKARLLDESLETPKPGNRIFERHELRMVATPQQSLEAAAAVARAAGLEAHILSDEIEGESREVGRVHCAVARTVAKRSLPFKGPCVLLSGGETSVTVRQRPDGSTRGRGGRAGEFCLGLAEALDGAPGIFALAADTDGIDGIEDNAGAFVVPDTLARADVAGLRLAAHMDASDAYGFFEGLEDLFVTGPTHTNVNDFRAILIL